MTAITIVSSCLCILSLGAETVAQSSGGSRSAAETAPAVTAIAIKETGVTIHRDPQSWWSVMMMTVALGILKWPGDSLRRLEDYLQVVPQEAH